MVRHRGVREPQNLLQYKVRNLAGESLEIGAREETVGKHSTLWSVQCRVTRKSEVQLKQFTVECPRTFSDFQVFLTVLTGAIDHKVPLDIIRDPSGNSSQPVLVSSNPDSPQEEPS